MAYDLALSEHGDLVIDGKRDLAGVSGIDLLDQRIRMRLQMRRGEWIYDDTDTLGSNLHRIISVAPDKASTLALTHVREALRGMDEISVNDVGVQTTDRDMTVTVFYSVNDDESDEQGEIREVQVTVQTASEAGG